jgi:hypothetical protein
MRLWEKELQKLGRILHAIGDKTSGQHRSNKISRSQATQLAQVARTLNRLRQLLSQEYVRRAILPELSIHEELPLVAIDRLMKAVDRAVQDRSAGDKKLAGSQLVKNFNDRSPFEWLVGERLPQVFERHFKRPAGLSRNSSDCSGRGLRWKPRSLSFDTNSTCYGANPHSDWPSATLTAWFLRGSIVWLLEYWTH